MPPAPKPKTVNYRLCNPSAPANDGIPSSFNLQDLLQLAKDKIDRPWIRKLDVNGARSHFLTYLVAKQGCLCGTLVTCEEGKRIQIVDAEKDGSTWEGTMEPKDDKGKKRKFQENALYFAIRENHVAVIQTKELSISNLQDFFVWFIQSRAELATGWFFTLQNLPSASAVQKLKSHRIKEIRIGKNAFSTIRTPTVGGTSEKRRRYTKSIAVDPFLMSVLHHFTKNDAIIEKLNQSENPGSIYVALEINYTSRTTRDAQEIMQAIAATVGGQDELSPEIILSGSGKIKGDELTIQGKVNVQCPDGNISGDDAMTRLAEWLTESIKNGKVLA